ncbi:MAG: hypothetical protein AAF927_00160 [Bacteroidota bacterium]
MNKYTLLAYLLLPLFLYGQNDKEEWFENSHVLDEHQPNIELWHNKTVNRPEQIFQNLKILNFDRQEALSVKLEAQKSSQKFIKEYKIYGLSIYRSYAYMSQKLLSYEPEFSATFTTEYFFSMEGTLFNQDGLGGLYEIRFDSLVGIGKNGVPHLLTNFARTEVKFFFEIEVAQDPFVLAHGYPTIELLVNGNPKLKEQIVRKDDQLSLRLSYPDSVDLAGSQFIISGFRMGERGCFGRNTIVVHKIESTFPLDIPNEEISIGYGGSFALILGEMYRVDSQGQRHRINLSPRQRHTFYKRARN